MEDDTGTFSGHSLRWAWIAILAAAALAGLEAQQLVTLIGWERTLPFARDLLPGAIATASMTLLAYLLIIGLVFVRRARKWALALGIGWGAIVAGAALWVIAGPFVKNLWQDLLLRAHLTNALVQYGMVVGTRLQMAGWVAGVAGVLVLASVKAFWDSPRERLDRGIILASIFYAAFYDLATAIVARIVTPH